MRTRTLPLFVGLLAICGCIERTVTIRSEPDHALVYLNDDEVGRSPVTVPFTWYGDYDIVIRKEGYETLKTHQRLHTPWYDLPGVDFFTETLLPLRIHDHRELPVYTLAEQKLPDKEDVISRAEEMREKALFTK